jgi:hypothetical protein
MVRIEVIVSMGKACAKNKVGLHPAFSLQPACTESLMICEVLRVTLCYPCFFGKYYFQLNVTNECNQIVCINGESLDYLKMSKNLSICQIRIIARQ